MPTTENYKKDHRERELGRSVPLPCAVARKVNRYEIDKVPEARDAVNGEWDKLASLPHPDSKGKGTWDIGKVREANEVRQEARDADQTVHFGQIAELCFQKGAELEDGDPLKK